MGNGGLSLMPFFLTSCMIAGSGDSEDGRKTGQMDSLRCHQGSDERYRTKKVQRDKDLILPGRPCGAPATGQGNHRESPVVSLRDGACALNPQF